MPSGKKTFLTPEQLRHRVDHIMHHWQSFSTFAALLGALMAANGLSARSLAGTLSRATGKAISFESINRYWRDGEAPPYSFVEDLLTTNALHLDPRRIQPATGGSPPGDQRVALFAAAGIIEVTPDSIRDWIHKVLVSHRELIESDAGLMGPCWGTMMAKFLSFHRQGKRRTLDDIATASIGMTADSRPAIGHRLSQLLSNRRPADAAERLALARYAGLDEHQVAYIEAGIAAGTILVGPTDRRIAFAAALNQILDKLGTQGVTLAQLARRCAAQTTPGASLVAAPDLSVWRHGRAAISLEKLRSLVTGLRHLGPPTLRDPVTPDEIDHLIVAAGFKAHRLTDTTHDIVARIGDYTPINNLLSDLRYAADLSMTAEDVTKQGKQLDFAVPSLGLLSSWEQPGRRRPTGQQVWELLRCYNHFVRRNGFPALSGEEIAKVVALAEREHAGRLALSHAESLGKQNGRQRRRPPDPSLHPSQEAGMEGGRET